VLLNGEIYNHVELRGELERLGHRFRSDHADSEPIVHAFEEWGIECVHRLRGMFALAIWDGRERELWLVRDRLGIKPLYWARYAGRFAFGSEIKALLADPALQRRVDREALFHYLSFLTAPAPQTLFEGVRKVPAGGLVRLRAAGTVEERMWWDPWDAAVPLRELDDDELAQRVLEALRESVALRKMADVPVGIFLSGGIDSSTNAALFAEDEAEPVRAFSIGYDDEYRSYPSELPWARLMARTIGADHHERILDLDDLLEFLPRMTWLQDEPLGDPVAVPLHFLAQLAREHGVPVCQAGEGSDELFFGYPSWRVLLRLQQADDLPVPRGLKRLAVATAAATRLATTRPVEALRRGGDGVPVFWGGAEGFGETQKRRLLAPDVREQLCGLSSWDALRPIRERFERNAWEPTHANWMTYLDLRLRLPELLLARIDRMTMGVALEARVPFLDHRLVELVLGIPTAAKVDRGDLKVVLKRAVSDLLPRELLDRPKQGFRVPVDEWLLGALGERARSEVDSFCRDSGLLDRDEAARLLVRPKRDAWYLLNLALWWKEWFAA
jgi:asparagine synthase (glutamine-hydrolysing)